MIKKAIPKLIFLRIIRVENVLSLNFLCLAKVQVIKCQNLPMMRNAAAGNNFVSHWDFKRRSPKPGHSCLLTEVVSPTYWLAALEAEVVIAAVHSLKDQRYATHHTLLMADSDRRSMQFVHCRTRQFIQQLGWNRSLTNLRDTDYRLRSCGGV